MTPRAQFMKNLMPTIIALSVLGTDRYSNPLTKYLGRCKTVYNIVVTAVIATATGYFTVTMYSAMVKFIDDFEYGTRLVVGIANLIFGTRFLLLYIAALLLAVQNQSERFKFLVRVGKSPHFHYNKAIFWLGQIVPCLYVIIFTTYSIFSIVFFTNLPSSSNFTNVHELSADIRNEYSSPWILYLVYSVSTMSVAIVFLVIYFTFGILLKVGAAINHLNKNAVNTFEHLILDDNNSLTHVLKKLCKEHADLCFIVEAVDQFCGYIFLLLIIFDLPSIVLGSYTLIKMPMPAVIRCGTLLAVAGPFLSTSMPLIVAAIWINEELHKFPNMLAKKISISCGDAQVDGVINGHFHRLSCNNWAMTFCKLCNITRSLIFSVFSMLVTYITLLLKFG